MPIPRSLRGWFGLIVLGLILHAPARGDDPPAKADDKTPPPPVQMTDKEDHKRIMDLLKMTSIRRGADGNNRQAPNAANDDEAKATPFPDLPDPLTLKIGKQVTSADEWWMLRRPEIVEDFDREFYGRVPKNTPKVNWEVTSTTKEKVGDIPVVTKTLVGHVDNSSYTPITVDIQLTLTTPAHATSPVPVIMEFGFNFGSRGPGAAGKAAPRAQPPAKGATPKAGGPFGPGGPGGGLSWQQGPMLEFASWLASSEYGRVLFPSTSHEALGLATVPTYRERRRLPIVYVLYTSQRGRFVVHYQRGQGHEASREEAVSPQEPEVFARILGWLGVGDPSG